MSVRRFLGAGLLFAAWAVDAAGLLVHPAGAAHKGADLLAMATDHRSQLITIAWLYLVSALLSIPALVLISSVTRARGRVLPPVACMVLLAGALGHAAEGTMNMLLTAIATIPADAAAKANVLDDSTSLVAPALVLAVVFDLALILIAGAAWRARLTSFWPLVIVSVAAVAGNVAPAGPRSRWLRWLPSLSASRGSRSASCGATMHRAASRNRPARASRPPAGARLIVPRGLASTRSRAP